VNVKGARATLPAEARLLGPPVILILVLLLVYRSTLESLARDWIRDPNYQHGLLIPFLSALLIWRSRRRLAAAGGSPSPLGLIGMGVSSGVLILGVAGAEVFTQRVSFVLMLFSVVLFLHGWARLRLVFFPISLLLLAIPLPYVIYYGATAPMQALAAKLALIGLQAVGVHALAQGNVIHLPQGSLEVAEACSGIRSLYAFAAVGAIVSYLTAISPWRKAALFLTTIPLAVAGNAVRVWGSGLGLWLVGPAAAQGFIHESFGVIVFAGTVIVFLFLRRMARALWSHDASSPRSSSSPPGSMRDSFAPPGTMI
jgi:exosortase